MALDEIKEHYPEVFKPFHKQAIADAIDVLENYGTRARVLDTTMHKAKAWKVAMAIREIHNGVHGLDIPNR